MLSRVGCHLCEQAEQVAEQLCGPEEWARVDVDADPALAARYTDHVPVVWVDGRLLAYWTLSESQLRDALAGHDWPAPPQL
ncbi:glutaredoxin family protein [Propionibacteriaceae bacterium Y1923]